MADGIVHIDIPVKDLETTPEFYSKVFGWELTPMPGEDFVLYTSDGAGISGGFTKPEVHQIGGCVGYVQVDNLEAAMESIVENGDRVIRVGRKWATRVGLRSLPILTAIPWDSGKINQPNFKS